MSPISFYTIFASMKQVVYKKSFEKYTTVRYNDFNPIKAVTLSNDFPSEFVYGASEKHPLFQMKETLEGEKHFVENFANPMCSVLKQYVMIVVETNGDKVVLKLFCGHKQRREGKPWFKVIKHVDYISVNIKTGDVYHGNIMNYQKKRKCTKSIRRNSFFMDPIGTLKSKVKNVFSQYTDKSYDETMAAFSEFMFLIDQRKNFETLSYSERLFRFYLDKRNIKYPNNFGIYTYEFFGPELKKALKKSDNKLVDALMLKHKISGKKIKKALHYCNKLNVGLYETVKKLFGEDWLNQDEDNIILEILNQPSISFHVGSNFNQLISKEELKKVYKLFKQSIIHQNLDVHTLQDHIRFYEELKTFGETDLKWMSSENKDDFRKEHLDWADKLQHYKRGTYYRHYPEYMYEEISKPIFDYYPILLDESGKYNEESMTQSNCVKGYVGRAGSIIISVRKGGLESTERATIEYRILQKNDKIICERVQSLGKYNQNLEEHWTPVLLKLDVVMLSCVKDKRFELVKLSKKCSNGAELHSDSHWEEDKWTGTYNLRWTVKNIENGGNPLLFFAPNNFI